jgi:hypothetical protein
MFWNGGSSWAGRRQKKLRFLNLGGQNFAKKRRPLGFRLPTKLVAMLVGIQMGFLNHIGRIDFGLQAGPHPQPRRQPDHIAEALGLAKRAFVDHARDYGKEP